MIRTPLNRFWRAVNRLADRLICAWMDHEPDRRPPRCEWCGARIPDEQEGMDRQW